MPEPVTLSSAEVAALLGLRPARFVDWVQRARREHGFPPKVPCTYRYSRAAVLAWIDSNGHTAPPPPINPALEADVTAAEAVLLGRARAMLAAE